MTQLIMIRHGQASFGQSNYDKLSELGREQARIAGQALSAQGLEFDVLASGDMQRQIVTAEQVALAFPNAPERQTFSAFNEYSAEALTAAYLPRVLEEDSALAAKGKEIFKDHRLFQKAFGRMTQFWLAGESHSLKNFETWPQFLERVRDGLADLHRNIDRDARIALCTSGGPIAVAVGSALGVTDETIIHINWNVYNASFTEFQSNKKGWRLMGFNNISHLRAERDSEYITHR